jgi:uncharacterized membrane protein
MVLSVILGGINAILLNVKRILVYPLGISCYFGYLVVEIWIAVRDTTVAGIALFVILDIVWIASALHGWRKHGKAIQNVGATDVHT